MKALYFDTSLHYREDYPMPKRQKGEALIRILRSGICNTDREIMNGYKGFTGVLGHECVGVVEECDEKSLIGKTVVPEINIGCMKCNFCKNGIQKHCENRLCLGIKAKDGCFSEYITMRKDLLHVVPSDISVDEAIFTEPLAAAFSAVKDASVRKGEKVLLLGDGRLSYLIYISLVYALSKNGWSDAEIKNNVFVKGRHEEKLSLFEKATPVLNLTECQRFFSVAFEATGSESGIDEAINAVKPQGRIVVKTTRAGKACIDLNTIVVNELKLIGSRCGDFKDALAVLKTHPYLPKAELFELKDYQKAFASRAFKVEFVL